METCVTAPFFPLQKDTAMSGPAFPSISVQLFDHDGSAELISGVINTGEYPRLHQTIDWQQEQIKLFGREIQVPRLTAYYGDVGYRYSGVEHPAKPLPGLLKRLKEEVELLSRRRFNAVLCNFYRNGQDGMGYHRDNEPAIDDRCIASLSFGATRKFKLRHRTSGQLIDLWLSDGDLLLMHHCQQHWEHALPKCQKVIEGRINLTFRLLADRLGTG
jgi:alkylated DNA repair dioxygenase AlkB